MHHFFGCGAGDGHTAEEPQGGSTFRYRADTAFRVREDRAYRILLYWKNIRKDEYACYGGDAAILACDTPSLIFAEPNLSTSLVVIVIIFEVYTAGISYRWIGGVLAVAIPAGALFIYLLTQG